MAGSGVRCERDVQREGGVPRRREANSKFKRQLQKFKYREGKGWGASEDAEPCAATRARRCVKL